MSPIHFLGSKQRCRKKTGSISLSVSAIMWILLLVNVFLVLFARTVLTTWLILFFSVDFLIVSRDFFNFKAKTKRFTNIKKKFEIKIKMRLEIGKEILSNVWIEDYLWMFSFSFCQFIEFCLEFSLNDRNIHWIWHCINSIPISVSISHQIRSDSEFVPSAAHQLRIKTITLKCFQNVWCVEATKKTGRLPHPIHFNDISHNKRKWMKISSEN